MSTIEYIDMTTDGTTRIVARARSGERIIAAGEGGGDPGEKAGPVKLRALTDLAIILADRQSDMEETLSDLREENRELEALLEHPHLHVKYHCEPPRVCMVANAIRPIADVTIEVRDGEAFGDAEARGARALANELAAKLSGFDASAAEGETSAVAFSADQLLDARA